MTHTSYLLGSTEERNKQIDHEVFASKVVECVGQVVGVVVARNQPTAQRAAKLVKIDYEDLGSPIITIQVCTAPVYYQTSHSMGFIFNCDVKFIL